MTTTMNGTMTVTDIDISISTPLPLNGAGANGSELTNDVGPSGTLKFTTGLILPPPDVKCTSLLSIFGPS